MLNDNSAGSTIDSDNLVNPYSVAESVWNEALEAAITSKEAIRLLMAVAAGKTNINTGLPVVVTFRDLADTKDRVTAEMSASERAAVSLDLT